MSELKIENLGADKIRDLFEEAFESQVGTHNNMGDAEAKVTNDGSEIRVELTVTGMAGSPSCDDFKNSNVEGAQTVTVSQDGYPEFAFELDAEETVLLNTNDYLVVYNYKG
jgi:hypothetical protein